MRKGLLIVLSGPSGVGKGTVCAALRNKTTDLVYSVSATTREPRPGEVDGVNYFFKSKQEFRQMIDNDELLEWAEYVGNYYGTPSGFVHETLQQGKDVFLEIEVQGAMKVKQKFPDAVFIFLAPPSLAELEKRIIGRGTDDEAVIKQRMDVAKDEIRLMEQYDYVVVNDDIDCACQRIISIIEAEHCKRERIVPHLTTSLNEVN